MRRADHGVLLRQRQVDSLHQTRFIISGGDSKSSSSGSNRPSDNHSSSSSNSSSTTATNNTNDWVEAIADNGAAYWWHRRTREVRWVQPQSIDDAAALAVVRSSRRSSVDSEDSLDGDNDARRQV